MRGVHLSRRRAELPQPEAETKDSTFFTSSYSFCNKQSSLYPVLFDEALIFSFQLPKKFSVKVGMRTTVFWIVTPCRFVDEPG
jgi:hypothetical protein